MIANNYTAVYNLEYGIMEWYQEDKRIVIEPDAKPDTKNKMEPDEFNALIENNLLVFIDYYVPFEFTYSSHCNKLVLIQKEQPIAFNRLNLMDKDCNKSNLDFWGNINLNYAI